jgi:hypothetical protein
VNILAGPGSPSIPELQKVGVGAGEPGIFGDAGNAWAREENRARGAE